VKRVRFSQSLEEILPVNVIEENVLLAISSAYHMVNGTRELNADFSRHEPIEVCGFRSASAKLM